VELPEWYRCVYLDWWPFGWLLATLRCLLTATRISAAEFASGAIDIETGGGDPTVIVNVTGSLNASYTAAGIFLYNCQQHFSIELTNKVPFNFPDATELNIVPASSPHRSWRRTRN